MTGSAKIPEIREELDRFVVSLLAMTISISLGEIICGCQSTHV
jgi:hypothetical protein